MKNALILALVLLFSNVAFSQCDFSDKGILLEEAQEINSFYQNSICKADFSRFRRRDKEVLLKFNNGFNLILISANKLAKSDKSIDPLDFPLWSEQNTPKTEFNINHEGWIVAAQKIQLSK